MNITSYTKNVNPKELTPQQIKQHIVEVAAEIYYLESPLKENFAETHSELGYDFHKVSLETPVTKQNKCAQNVPFVFADNPQPSKSIKRKNKDKAKLYPEAFENSSHIKLFKRVARLTLQRFVNQWGVAGAEKNGEWIFFVANAKGTKQYFTKQYWRFHDTCETLDKHYRFHYFDTVTCNPELFSSDLIIRYRQFSERIGKYCRYMSRSLKGKAVCVIESTASGLPHAHIIYYTNKEQKDIKERHKKGTKYNYIYGGKLKERSVKWWQSGFCELRKDEKGDTANYLSKYLSKVSETDLRNLLKKVHWSKTDWKMILTVLLPVLSCVRQFRLPQLKNLPKENQNESLRSEFLAEQKSSSDRVVSVVSESVADTTARLRAYLKALMIKSPIPCITNVVIAQYKAFTTDYGEDFDKINSKSVKEKEEIAKNCTPLTCGGCPYARLIKNILFDEPFYNEEVDNTELFESYLFGYWYGVYKKVGNGQKWATDKEEQEIFINFMKNKIAQKCGGAFAGGSIELMLNTHHSLWFSVLPKEILSFGVELLTFYKNDIQQKEDTLNLYEEYQSFFRKFMLHISASGVIITEEKRF